jgi:hypothetical protein
MPVKTMVRLASSAASLTTRLSEPVDHKVTYLTSSFTRYLRLPPTPKVEFWKEAEVGTIKVILIGFGLLSLLWLGSCAVIGAGTAVAVSTAVTSIGNEVEEAEQRHTRYEDREELEDWNDEDAHYDRHHYDDY